MKLRVLFFAFSILVLHEQFAEAQDYSGFERRVALLLNYTADQYSPPSPDIGDPEKYYWPVAIARFEKYGLRDSLANSYVQRFAGNSPFHFTLVGMARILNRYSHSPAIVERKALILQKVFERQDSFNPWTGEGTENHVNMSRTSGYLYAQAAMDDASLFNEAQKNLSMMEDWLRYWSKQVYNGGTGEWNSSTYLFYNLVGWLNLYDYAASEDVRKMARAVLDYYATELALHYSFGAVGGSEMRGGNSSTGSATAYLAWLWFGNGSDLLPARLNGNQFIQCVHAATSSYKPPSGLTRIAKKEDGSSFYRISQPSYLLDKPSFVKAFLYSTPFSTMGSSISAYGGFTGATSQIVPWKLVIKNPGDGTPVEISGNGSYYNGRPLKGRDPFTQVVQHENILIQMTCVPANEESIYRNVTARVEEWKERWYADFRNRFPQDTIKRDIVNVRADRLCHNESFVRIPAGVNHRVNGATIWVYTGKTLVVLTTLTGKAAEVVNEGAGVFFTDRAPKGSVCGFIVHTENYGEEDVNGVVKRLTGEAVLRVSGKMVRYRPSGGVQLTAVYRSAGKMTEATSDWGYGKASASPFISSPPLRQPAWPSGKGWGRIPALNVGGVRVDYNSNWPVWEGTGLSLRDRMLRIHNGQKVYEVNYQGEVPQFRETAVTPEPPATQP